MRVSSGSRCYRSFHCSMSEPLHPRPKPPINPSSVTCTISSFKSCQSVHVNFQLINFMKLPIRSHQCFPVMGGLPKPICKSSGFSIGNSLRCFSLGKSPSFSSSHPLEAEGVRSGNALPWLATNNVAENNVKKVKWSELSTTKKGDISWESPNRKLEKMRSLREYSEKTFGKRSNKFAGDESAKKDGKTPTKSASRSTWDVAAENFVGRGSESADERVQGSDIRLGDEDQRTDYNGREATYEEEIEEEIEANPDPRWDKIKSRFRGLVDGKAAPVRPGVQRWSKQENWGRKTLREAHESSIPKKMVGEGIYGVGPVLAALSAGRREFYALYMQEGLDLSSNNRKKKDKKGFEKVLKLAERNALTIKEISKHDLNMLSDNRPHQGLVLDTSPLEMVKIIELDPVSPEEDKGSLWLALDEVTDPQNLGAIIRSAYFFGASGVVLCAKNSAPLSGVVSKASAGSLELMELRYCKNMMKFLASSAENGWRVLGASVSSKAVALKEVQPDAPTILVLGSEGTGLRPLVERSCTQLVRIPGNIPVDVSVDKDTNTETTELGSLDEFRSFLAVESLNVSVAAGVLIHHLIGSNNQTDSHMGVGDESCEISPLH